MCGQSLYPRVFVGRRRYVKKGGHIRISGVGGGGIPAESEIPRCGYGGGVICASSFLYSSVRSQCEAAVRVKHGDFTT